MRFSPQPLCVFIIVAGLIVALCDAGAAGLRMLRALPQPKVLVMPRVLVIPRLHESHRMQVVPALDRALRFPELFSPDELEWLPLQVELPMLLATGVERESAKRYAYAELLAEGGLIAFPRFDMEDPLSISFFEAERKGDRAMILRIFRRYHARYNPLPVKTEAEIEEDHYRE